MLDGRRVVWLEIKADDGTEALVVLEYTLVQSPPEAGRRVHLARPEEIGGNVQGTITNVIWKDYR